MGHGNKVEFLVAICALVTSVVAVYIAWDQGRVMRAQQHGEVFPILQVEGYVSNNATQSSMGITVSNRGVGPAMIERVIVEVKGEVVTSLSDELADFPRSQNISWNGMTGIALGAGDSVTPIELNWRRNEVAPAKVWEAAAKADEWSLRICYCSVFNRCWETSGIGTARADRVDACPRGEGDVFEDLGIPDRPSAPASITDRSEPSEEDMRQ